MHCGIRRVPPPPVMERKHIILLCGFQGWTSAAGIGGRWGGMQEGPARGEWCGCKDPRFPQCAWSLQTTAFVIRMAPRSGAGRAVWRVPPDRAAAGEGVFGCPPRMRRIAG
jgi:hypothetical protein